MDGSARVAVLEMDASTPAIRTRLPAGTSSAGMKYLEEKAYSIRVIKCKELTELRLSICLPRYLSPCLPRLLVSIPHQVL